MFDRQAVIDAERPAGGSLSARTRGQWEPNRDLYRFTAELVTSDWTMLADLVSPEQRLSDVLNGSLPTVDVMPRSLRHWIALEDISCVGTRGFVNKNRLLAVFPVHEPERAAPTANVYWQPTAQHQCILVAGNFRIAGTIHTEIGRSAQVALRSLDEHFVAVTTAKVALPNGDMREQGVVLVNHRLLDLVAIQDA